jgi:hypothetical protein
MSKILDGAKSFDQGGLNANTLDNLDSPDFEQNLGLPSQDDQVLSSKIDGTRSWITVDLDINWGDIGGTLSNQNDLWTELQNRYLKSETFSSSEFINFSDGVDDAGKPILLNDQGQIDPSMLDVSVFYYVGPWNPEACTDPSTGCEYPDPSGESYGAFWVVQDLTSDYTFQSGDLFDKTVSNGDFMVYSAAGWSIMAGEMNPLLYYRLDGTNAITNSFAGGNKQYKLMADGTDDQDGVNVRQLQAGLNTKADTVHTHEISDTNGLQAALDAKADDADLLPIDDKIDTHIADTANPHSVTKAQVGLGNVDNTSDLDKPISTATQAALDAKENSLGNPSADNLFLSSLVDGTRSWTSIDTTVEWGEIVGQLDQQTDLWGVLE